MTTEKTSHKSSAMGRSAFAAAARKQEAPFTPGAIFEHDGELYRVTNGRVAGLRSWFSYERVPSIALYIQRIGRATRPVPPVEYIELPADVLERVRAMAPTAPDRPETVAPCPCGDDDGLPCTLRGCPYPTPAACPECDPDFAEVESEAEALERATTDLSAVKVHLIRHHFKPRPGNSVADDVDNALDHLTSQALGAESRKIEAEAELEGIRKTLALYGIDTSKERLELAVDRYIDTLREEIANLKEMVSAAAENMLKAELRAMNTERQHGEAIASAAALADKQAKRIVVIEGHLQSAHERANEYERQLSNIKGIVDKADIIPF